MASAATNIPQPPPAPAPAPAPASAPATSTTAPQSTMWNNFVEFLLVPIDKGILFSAPELGHLAPIILSMGAAFISLVTLNYPVFMFSASSVEALFVYNALSTVTSFGVTPSMLNGKSETKCKSYFQTMTPSRFEAIFSQGLRKEFPNSPLYFISFAAAYCIQSMYFFSQEASELGPQYSNRPYLAIIAAAMFISLYTIYLLSYSCETAFSLMLTIVLGIFVGYFICYQNFLLFGKPAVDLLFIPSLARRSGMDYICVTTNSSLEPASINYVPLKDTTPRHLHLTWKPVPNAKSYIVTFYSTDSATPANGLMFETKTVSSTTLAQDSTKTLNTSTYYYGSVIANMSDGSASAPITSGAIQVP